MSNRSWLDKLFGGSRDESEKIEKFSYEYWLEKINDENHPWFEFDEKQGYRLNWERMTPFDLDRLFAHLSFIAEILILDKLSLAGIDASSWDRSVFYPTKDDLSNDDFYYKKILKSPHDPIVEQILNIHRIKVKSKSKDIVFNSTIQHYTDTISYLMKLLKAMPVQVTHFEDNTTVPSPSFAEVFAVVLYSPFYIIQILGYSSVKAMSQYLDELLDYYKTMLNVGKSLHERTVLKRKLFITESVIDELEKIKHFTLTDYAKRFKTVGRYFNQYGKIGNLTYYFLFTHQIGRPYGRRVLKLRQMVNLPVISEEERDNRLLAMLNSLNYDSSWQEDVLMITHQDIANTAGEED